MIRRRRGVILVGVGRLEELNIRRSGRPAVTVIIVIVNRKHLNKTPGRCRRINETASMKDAKFPARRWRKEYCEALDGARACERSAAWTPSPHFRGKALVQATMSPLEEAVADGCRSKNLWKPPLVLHHSSPQRESYLARIRTLTKGTKKPCATVTPRGNKPGKTGRNS